MAGARFLFVASAVAALSAAPLHAQNKSVPATDADRDAVCFVASAYLSMISDKQADTMRPDELRRTSAFHYVMPFYAARLIDRFDDAKLATALTQARTAIKTMDQQQTAASCMNDYKAAIARVQNALDDKSGSAPAASAKPDSTDGSEPGKRRATPEIVELPMPSDDQEPAAKNGAEAPKSPSWYSDGSESR